MSYYFPRINMDNAGCSVAEPGSAFPPSPEILAQHDLVHCYNRPDFACYIMGEITQSFYQIVTKVRRDVENLTATTPFCRSANPV